MTALGQPPSATRAGGLAPLYGAARTRLALVALLFAAAALGWLWTAREMRGMDNGPWTALGGFGWFTGVWVVMMAAMMLPSVAPTVALYSRMTKQRSPILPLIFGAGYVLVWVGVGVLAFGIAAAVHGVDGNLLAWNRAGRWVAGATLLMASAYERSPLKDMCLGKCRSPLGFLLGSWREGPTGALQMGARHGGWCAGCCWALMASMFALGIMSLAWMALVAGLIAAEKMVPWRRAGTYGTAVVLLALGLFVLVAPSELPGLTTPGHGALTTPGNGALTAPRQGAMMQMAIDR
jgi:predicted metal-binding membrane protein